MRLSAVAPWAASLRVRLTLWNVGVLGLMLLGMGAALHAVLQETLITHIDASLGAEAGDIGRADVVGLFHAARAALGSVPPPLLDRGGQEPGAEHRLPPVLLSARGGALAPFSPAAPYDPAAWRAALGGAPVYSTGRAAGGPARLLSFPLRAGGRPGGAVIGAGQIARPLAPFYVAVRQVTGALLTLALPALLIAGLCGAFLTACALRPVREITDAAGRIEATDLSGRLAVAGRDELAEMAGTFNAMLARLEEAFRQRADAYAEMETAYAKMEAAYEQQRRFTADASHELKTPLTVIQGTVSLALSGPRTEARLRQSLETVGRASGTMTHIVQDLLLLARSDAGELSPDRRAVAVGDVLALAAESLAGRPPGEAAPVRLCPPGDGSPALRVSGDPDHLTRLFVNLMDNAARHTPPAGDITVAAAAEGGWAAVAVRDTGAGIAPEHLPHVFERFYRADTARARRHGGSGLGLAIARSIAEAHGGTLTLTSTPGEGTCALVRLPLLSDPAGAATPGTTPGA